MRECVNSILNKIKKNENWVQGKEVTKQISSECSVEKTCWIPEDVQIMPSFS